MSVAGSPAELSLAGLAALGARNACDEEPIAHSGAVQPHGFLLGVDPATWLISIVSNNVPMFTGTALPEVLGSPLSSVIGSRAAGRLRSLIALKQLSDVNPLTVILPEPPHVSWLERSERPWPAQFEMVGHRSSGLIVLELQPLWNEAADRAAVQSSLRRALSQPQDAAGVAELCQASVQELRRLTGYDRVMAYRFAPDGHGEVIAEACREDQVQYLGLHYPAGDIPRQARMLFFKNRCRLIPNVHHEAVPLSCLPSRLATDVDLGHAQLRSVSPIHLEYLRNMDVAATMTVSVVVDDRLWGLLACHHESVMELSYFVRLAGETLGSMLALQIRALETRQQHEYADQLRLLSAQVVTAMTAGENLASGAESVESALLGMVAADGAVLQLDGQRIAAGRVPTAAVVDDVLGALAERAGLEPLVTDSLPELLRAGATAESAGPDPGVDACGALYMPLDDEGDDCVLWLRGEHASTVRWAGAPSAGDAPGDDRLRPRASFAEWRESRRGCSRPWLGAEIATAREFADAMPELLLHRVQQRLAQLALDVTDQTHISA